jgi:CRISPR-associated endonuclease/helicase Cas3
MGYVAAELGRESEGAASMWAHSLNAAGARHALADHLYGTAERAAGFAAAFGARDAGYFLGLAHDAGKASCSWQEGLARAEQTGGRVGVDHKTLGVYLADRRGLGIAQFALHGHHGGLTCRDHIGRTIRQERADGGGQRRAEAEAALRLVVPELFDGAPVPDLLDLADELHAATQHAVNGLRVFGYSWSDIASRLGTTR